MYATLGRWYKLKDTILFHFNDSLSDLMTFTEIERMWIKHN